jgi:hypothetical protein
VLCPVRRAGGLQIYLLAAWRFDYCGPQAITIGIPHDDRHLVLKNQLSRELLRTCAKGLRLLRSIDAVQPYLDGPAFT